MKYNSIREYIDELYYNDIFEEVNDYFLKNRFQLNFNTNLIPNPSYVKLEDISIEKIYYRDDIFQDKDEFKLTISAEFNVSGKSRYDYENDIKNMWFIATCYGVFENGIRNFKIDSVEEYINDPYPYKKALSQYAIPYIPSEDLDKRAEAFLEKYYKEALEVPMALPVKNILQNIGVHAYYAPLSDDVYGKTFFSVSKEEVYDKNKNIVIKQIKPRSILINRNIKRINGLGSINNTIIHECIHIELHSKFFELQKIISGSSKSIVYRVKQENNILNSDEQKAFDLMEWQATMLAPRILMPAKTTRMKYHQLRDEIGTLFPLESEAYKLQIVIDQLAEFFKVSKIAAKIRLIDLGYQQATGINNFVNGEKIPDFSFKTKQLNRNQTYVIDFIDSVIQIRTNDNLYRLSQEGKITYVNGLVVVNSPKYVTVNNQGQKQLTPYALEHLDECAFIFSKREIEINNEQYRTYLASNFLCRPEGKNKYVPADYDKNSPSNKELETFADEIENAREAGTLHKRLHGEFHEDFSDVIKELGYLKSDGTPNYYQISKLTSITDKTIKSYVSGETKPSKEKLLAICGGLRIHPKIAYLLLERAGIIITKSYNEDDMIYCNLIDLHYDEGLERWNKYLLDSKKTQLP